MANYVTNLPVNNIFNITAYFGQKGSYWKNGHKGIDFTAANKKLYSICSGEVTVVGWDEKGWGRYVSIKPEGFDRIRIITCHMVKDSVKVKKGDKVSRTTVLGTMGSTGNSSGTHVHIEMRVDNTPVDPTPYLLVPNKKASGLKDTDFKFDIICQKTALQSILDDFDGVSQSKPVTEQDIAEQAEKLKSEVESLKNELSIVKDSLALANANLLAANQKINSAKKALE